MTDLGRAGYLYQSLAVDLADSQRGMINILMSIRRQY
jgi:hypothetical protein